MFECPAENDQGYPLISWIQSIFGECTYSVQDIVSLFIGYTSIVFWFCAQVPQLITNHRRRAAESLSPLFLFTWLLGDTSNLIGCIYTGQLPFQTNLAIYFVIMDGVLLLQWIYFHLQQSRNSQYSTSNREYEPLLTDTNQHTDTHLDYEGFENRPRTALIGGWRRCLLMFLGVCASEHFTRNKVIPSSLSHRHSTRELFGRNYDVDKSTTLLFMATTDDERAKAAGLFFAWVSTTCYLSSRIPQIMWNVSCL